ncbi:MAG: site-specific DNA-methyltransferase [Polyangiaceae bacterium]|nr:site-specific DNA-methyltransferase [Polyangiaceae bacterium]
MTRAELPPLARPAVELYEGDCLELLARPEHRARQFELVYVDPPFNTERAHGARRGPGWRHEGPAAFHDAHGGLDAFLAYLEPRLVAAAARLAPGGSLWVHLDHRAVHEVKVLLDRALGRDAYRAEIIWVPGNGARRSAGPAVTHQTLLVYAPGAMLWNTDDPILREPYADRSLAIHFRKVDGDGRRYRERVAGGRTYRYYADTGRALGSVWTDCPAMGANTPFAREATGYPTQKPERLLERIVRGATRAGDAVLDPMCGSGTTLAVAARLGRPSLGIDASPLACSVARARLGLGAAPAPTAPRRVTRRARAS